MQRFADIRTVVSIEERINEDMRIGDFIEGSQEDPLKVAESSSISDQMQSIISNLPERERIIVDLYYFQEYSFKENCSHSKGHRIQNLSATQHGETEIKEAFIDHQFGLTSSRIGQTCCDLTVLHA